MFIRKLKLKDAHFMLEWMHDQSVVEKMNSDFCSKKLEDCITFIKNSVSENNVNFAIVNDSDEYIGTVSLKNINRKQSTAEFAIAIRKIGMGRGYSWYGMQEILKYAFEIENLKTVYWCVSRDNYRACRFYDKHQFKEIINVSDEASSNYANVDNLKWYLVNKEDYLNRKTNLISGCKVIKIKTVGEEGTGKLSFFETIKDIPFDIKRIYYISKTNEGEHRGYHAHKELKQLIFCPYGKVNIIVDDGYSRNDLLLDDPSIGLMIEKPIWREMVWMKSDSVLCVAASDYYREEDYIREYSDFLAFKTRSEGI